MDDKITLKQLQEFIQFELPDSESGYVMFYTMQNGELKFIPGRDEFTNILAGNSAVCRNYVNNKIPNVYNLASYAHSNMHFLKKFIAEYDLDVTSNIAKGVDRNTPVDELYGNLYAAWDRSWANSLIKMADTNLVKLDVAGLSFEVLEPEYGPRNEFEGYTEIKDLSKYYAKYVKEKAPQYYEEISTKIQTGKLITEREKLVEKRNQIDKKISQIDKQLSKLNNDGMETK